MPDAPTPVPDASGALAPALDSGSRPARGLAGRAAQGAAWIGLSLAATQGIQLVTHVILASLLSPADYGLVAIASLTLAFLGPFHDSGLEAALIARRDEVREAASTVAWTTPFTGLLAWAAAATAAPLVAWLFEQHAVVPILRVLALDFVLRGLSIAPLAILTKELALRSRAMANVAGSLAMALVGISLAVAGAGCWALVAGHLAGTLTTGAAAWLLVPWWPRGGFHRQRLRELVHFGRHLVAGNVLGFIGSYLDTIAVGRVLGSAALGVYTTSFRWGCLPSRTLSLITNQVAFPTYVLLHEDRPRWQAAYLRVVRLVTTISFPSALGLALVAPALVHALYPERWEGVIAPLRVFAFFGLVSSLVGTTGDVFKAGGRPGWIPGLLAVRLPALVLLLWLLIGYGTSGAALALVLAAVASGSVALLAGLRVIGLPVRALLRAIAPQALAAACMAAVVASVTQVLFACPPALILAVQVLVGAAAYLGALALLAPQALADIRAALSHGLAGVFGSRSPAER